MQHARCVNVFVSRCLSNIDFEKGMFSFISASFKIFPNTCQFFSLKPPRFDFLKGMFVSLNAVFCASV